MSASRIRTKAMLGASVVAAAVAALMAAPAEGAAALARQSMHHGATLKILAPKKHTNVVGPKVLVQVGVKELALVLAGSPLKDGEGHLHFFIDVPATHVRVGALIPLDSTTRYVHAGKPPFDQREIELAPGKHTITVVAANSAHLRLAEPKPVSVTFMVTAPK